MALVVVNRVSQKVAATGTGAVALSTTAQTGFRTLAAAGVADASTLYYTIEDGVAWECGLATYTAGTNTIARQVLISSAGNAAINLTLNAVFSATVLAEGLAQYLTSSALTPYAKTADVAAAYAPLASPPLTGSPTAPTAAAADNSTKIATTAYADRAVAAAAGGGAPSAVITGANGATVTAAAADKGKMYVLAGSGVLVLPAAVQTAGWYAYVRKNDNVLGSWSVSPSGKTIDGLSTINCYCEDFIVYWDGTNFRTQNRQRGWISAGSMVTTSATSALLITNAFGDTELRDAEFVSDTFPFAAADYPCLQLRKNGATQTTGYVNQGTFGATLIQSVASAMPISSDTGGSNHRFRVAIFNINLINDIWNRMEAIGWSNGNNRNSVIGGIQNTSNPVQGAVFVGIGGTSINAGAQITQRVYRN
jgi:hypothetical protein